jgi:plastocyanin
MRLLEGTIMTRYRALLPITLLPLGVLAGCGSSSSTKSTNAYATAPPVVVVTPKSIAWQKNVTMVRQGGKYAYSPRTITVTAGTIVTWKNGSGAPHTVTFHGPGLPNSSVGPGKSVSVTFKRGGTFAYHCTIHPYMRGAVIVNAR